MINQLVAGPASVRFGDRDAPSIENWKQVHVLRGHRSNVSDLSWSPDGKFIASASFDNLVIVWDVASGRQVGWAELRRAGRAKCWRDTCRAHARFRSPHTVFLQA